MKHSTLHYKHQRDLLVEYLMSQYKAKKSEIAKVLGVSTAAVSMQFPTRQRKGANE